MMPDRTIPDNGMNSFNHYSYGSIGDWLYRAAVGIQETSPGFKTLAIKPHVGGGFTFMKAEQLTPYGRIAAEWHNEEGMFSLAVMIPVNTTAEIYVPSPSADKVLLDGQTVASCADIKVVGHSNGYTKIEVGSGKYLFEVK
jgi:alpha-L-rhamnosidase